MSTEPGGSTVKRKKTDPRASRTQMQEQRDVLLSILRATAEPMTVRQLYEHTMFRAVRTTYKTTERQVWKLTRARLAKRIKPGFFVLGPKAEQSTPITLIDPKDLSLPRRKYIKREHPVIAAPQPPPVNGLPVGNVGKSLIIILNGVKIEIGPAT